MNKPDSRHDYAPFSTQETVRVVPKGKSRTEWRAALRAYEKSVKKRIKEERAALESGVQP